MELIDPRKFSFICDICKKEKVGSCLKCEEIECHRYFHAECAQRKKMCIYPIENKTILYCRTH